ncbi:hypothetical protein Tco_0217137 [Tanacetum coccineum]
MVPFIKELGYTGKCDMLSEIHTDLMHQPWRTFVVVINRCISGKSIGLDSLGRQDLKSCRGMFYKENVDFVALLWEDLIFQSDNKDISLARKENMPYPRFTKTHVLEDEPAKKPKRAKHLEPAKKSTPAKKDVSSKKPSRKQSTGGIELLSDAALLEEAQLKKALKRSKRDTFLQAGGSSEEAYSKLNVPNKPKMLSLTDKKKDDEEDDSCWYVTVNHEVQNKSSDALYIGAQETTMLHIPLRDTLFQLKNKRDQTKNCAPEKSTEDIKKNHDGACKEKKQEP